MIENIRKKPAMVGFQMCIAVLMTVAAGCGEAKIPTGKLSGKVMYQDQPVTAGTVTFRNEQHGIVAAGDLTPTGEYHLLFAGGPDIPANEYLVTVTPPEAYVPVAADLLKDGPKPPTSASTSNATASKIPAKYRNFTTSGLSKILDEGENTYDIVLQD